MNLSGDAGACKLFIGIILRAGLYYLEGYMASSKRWNPAADRHER